MRAARPRLEAARRRLRIRRRRRRRSETPLAFGLIPWLRLTAGGKPSNSIEPPLRQTPQRWRPHQRRPAPRPERRRFFCGLASSPRLRRKNCPGRSRQPRRFLYPPRVPQPADPATKRSKNRSRIKFYRNRRPGAQLRHLSHCSQNACWLWISRRTVIKAILRSNKTDQLSM